MHAEFPHKIHEVFIPSQEGTLEAILTVPIPEVPRYAGAAVVCHPHPLYGGSMQSKVVVTASHAFLSLGLPALRFNFRGVGRSGGKYDHGAGEQRDISAAIDYISGISEKIIIAGHSFGAWTGMKAGCRDGRVKMLIGIGTPVNLGDMSFLMECPKPKLFIHGTGDQIIPLEQVETLYSALPAPKKMIKIMGADHFFTGRLDELSEAVRILTEKFFY